MTLHFAGVLETIADHRGDAPALICGDSVRSWRTYETRAARLARVLADAGIGPDDKVGIYLHNCNEYLESQFAAWKRRACPINVNYRYKADELVYLLDNADARALVYQAAYADQVAAIRPRLPKLELCLQVEDGSAPLAPGSLDFESALGDADPLPRLAGQPDDVYMLYTGGTTGMPKGVMYPGGGFCQGLLTIAAAGRGLTPPTNLAQLPAFLDQVVQPPVSLPACPLMHGTGMWLGALAPHFAGGCVVTSPQLGLDPHRLWQLIAEQRVTDLVIVGDAFARPLLEALDAAADRGAPYALSGLRQIISSGVMWSAEVKRGLLRHLDVVLADFMGSSEGGMGSSITTRETPTETARFQLNEGVKVFTDDDREVRPGSEEIGRVATSGMVPIGYYKDPEKSAATFREIDGVRYSFPGDYARVAEDGSVVLLGRGSACINTAGEKVFPEEVEEALKRHDAVTDCLVVGVADERLGQKVVALVSLQAVAQVGEQPGEQDLVDFTRTQLAGYKVPKRVLICTAVQRAPNGKADYAWARQEAGQRLAEAAV